MSQQTITLRSGHKMPALGLGTWQLTDHTADTVVAALDKGYRMIDTSGDYGTQPGIGKGLGRTSLDRADIFIVTKVEETDDAYAATRKNLEELGIDYADLVLIHRPPQQGAGEDLWRGLIRAKEEGLARDIGVSNYSTDKIDALIAATGETPVVNQIEWSPMGHSDAMRRYADDKDMVIQAYSPLTRATKLSEGDLKKMADKYGKTPAQLILRWNIQSGTVPLPKASRTDHMEENIHVFDFEIDDDDMRTIDAMNTHYSVFGQLPYA